MKKSRTTMIVTFLAPALIMFAVIFVYPIIRTIIMSVFKVPHITASVNSWEFVGLQNYIKLLNTSIFKTSLWNLFRIWAFGGVAVMTISLLFAAIINSGIRYKGFFKAVIYMPNVISAVALATMWMRYVFDSRYGLLTTFFDKIGWEAMAQVQWLSPDLKFYALVFAYCFGMVGYHMLIFSSGIERIPFDLYEASRIDGASKPKQFFKITLPLLKSVFKTNVIMWSITSAGFFVWSQLFGNVTMDTQTITPMVYLYAQMFGTGNTITERDAGLGAAIGVTLALFVVISFILTNVIIRNDDLEY